MQRVALLAFALLAVSCHGDYSEKLSGGYLYVDEGGAYKVIHGSLGGVSIYGEIIDYEYDEDFIVALQKPDTATHLAFIQFELGDQVDKKVEAKKILETEPYFIKIFSQKLNYWIISHNHNKTFGPLTKLEFEKLHDSLGIDEDLNFD